MIRSVGMEIAAIAKRGKGEQLARKLEEQGVRTVLHWTEQAVSRDSCLYIADTLEACRRAKENGYFVLPYLHEYNSQEDFTEFRYGVECLDEVELSYLEEVACRLQGKPLMILETKRCRIREIVPADVARLYEIYKDPEISEYMESLYEDIHEEIGYTKDYIHNMYGFYGIGMWVVEEKETGVLIGRAGIEYTESTALLEGKQEAKEAVELGFMIALAKQRQGYAYEVCKAILNYALREKEFQMVYAMVKEGNTASAGLCRKLGMQQVARILLKGEPHWEYRMEQEMKQG